MGRPLSGAACQSTWIAPRWAGSVAAVRLRGRPGAAYGTTVLLSGEGWLPALRSLTVTTVKAYCVPYVSEPGGIVIVLVRTSPTGAWAPPLTDVTVYRTILRPCPLAGGQVTTTLPSGFSVAVTDAGGSGTSRVGFTGLLVPFGPAPFLLTACTVNR